MYPDIPLTSLLVALVLNWYLYGVLTVQIYLYYLAFPDDRPWTKGAAYASYFLETIHTIFITLGIHSIIKSRSLVCDSNLDCSSRLLMTAAVPLIGGLAALITNVTYIWRIHVITQSRILVSALLVLTISQLVSAVAFMAVPSMWKLNWSSCMVENVFYGRNRHIIQKGFAWLIISAICDVAIATTMVYSLLKEKILSKELKWRVSRIIRLVIETGTTTATVNIITLILLATIKWTGAVYVTPMIVLSKVYGNAMMVLLNNRMSIPGSRSRPPTIGIMSTLPNSFLFQTVHQEHTSPRMDSGVFQVEVPVVGAVAE
ncbi:hypothetical protein AMATHDRAFT_8783 [Amanita thiersii Skay4041]|uniref:DUF6534 domain-containing protein n=1 Tax=Amanita thiersii Skay4041 TaxID=703135 RepID=A0A2A9NBR8_9AGAR|nr:hypothetical protein AMATHDRAFT_8783 [Amanita thiersii Skay4041]